QAHSCIAHATCTSRDFRAAVPYLSAAPFPTCIPRAPPYAVTHESAKRQTSFAPYRSLLRCPGPAARRIEERIDLSLKPACRAAPGACAEGHQRQSCPTEVNCGVGHLSASRLTKLGLSTRSEEHTSE